MKKSRILAFVFGFFLIVLAGGVISLAVAPIAPHAQVIEKTVPDDQIPR